jgi:hypothetical protein
VAKGRAVLVSGSALSPDAQSIILWGDVVARLRFALISADLARVEEVLKEGGKGGAMVTDSLAPASAELAPVAKLIRSEFFDVESQVVNVKVASRLKRGLVTGRLGGEVGALDLASVDTTDLEAAIAEADERGCSFPETVHLRSTAVFVVRVRKLVAKEAWDAVRKEMDVRYLFQRFVLLFDRYCLLLFSVMYTSSRLLAWSRVVECTLSE